MVVGHLQTWGRKKNTKRKLNYEMRKVFRGLEDGCHQESIFLSMMNPYTGSRHRRCYSDINLLTNTSIKMIF